MINCNPYHFRTIRAGSSVKRINNQKQQGDITYRSATLDDVPKLLDLACFVFLGRTDTSTAEKAFYASEAGRKKLEKKFKHKIQTPKCDIVLKEAGGELQGMVVIGRAPFQRRGAWLSSFLIKPEVRGNQSGPKLIKEAERRCHEMGYISLHGSCRPGLLKFYKHLGCEISGESNKQHGIKYMIRKELGSVSNAHAYSHPFLEAVSPLWPLLNTARHQSSPSSTRTPTFIANA